MSRYTIYLRESAKGWEWSKKPFLSLAAGWGYYKTRGQAISAAKRSTNKVAGGKTNPADYEFIETPKEGGKNG